MYVKKKKIVLLNIKFIKLHMYMLKRYINI